VSSPFARTHPLSDGPRVRLRLAWRGDAASVARLLARRGLDAHDLEIGRLLAFDPSRRIVLCAFAPIDGQETLVGIGAIDLDDGAEPDTLVVDERLAGGGLATLLGDVLVERSRAHGRRVA
jgi:GNAT superfamily N-acetyltransferase